MERFSATRIKQRYPENLIIGITGHREEAVMMKCRRRDMDLVETKPVDLHKLLSV